MILFVGVALLVPALFAYSQGESMFLPLLLLAFLMILPGLPRLMSNFGQFARETATGWWHRLQGKPVEGRPWNFAVSLLTLQFIKAKQAERLSRSEALVIASLAWLIIPLVGTIPYMAAGFQMENALFESVSGWTSTGLTTIASPETLPLSLIFFRSFTQWVGGVGIIIFALIVIKAPAASELLKAEGREGIDVGIRNTVNKIWLIYFTLTILGALFLWFSGLTVFQAINMAMAAIATGGFLPSHSLAFTVFQKIIMILIMMAGATSFALHSEFFQGRFQKMVHNTEFKVLLMAIPLFAVIMYLLGDPLDNAFFNVTAAISTAGFTVENLGGLSDFSKYMLLLLMVSGASSGSTVGGVKLWRMATILKSLRAKIRSFFLPHGTVQVIKVNGKPVSQDQVVESGSFIFLYSLLLLSVAAVFMALGLPSMDAFFTVASALGNVGLTTVSMASLPLVGKAGLMIVMYLGRIEILPSLVLLKYLRGG